MARVLASTIVSEITSASVRPIMLVALEFDSATVRLWSGIGSKTIGGDVFTGAGSMMSIGPAEETLAIKSTGASIILTGISSANLALALNEDYQDRVATVWLGFVDSSGVYIDRVQIFKGRMDLISITENGDTSTVTINIENILIALERTRERRFTDEDQQKEFSGDLGFSHVTSLQQLTIPWGRT